MKIYISIIIVYLALNSVFCQDDNTNWLNIGLYVPDNHDDLSGAHLQKLQTKLSSALSNNGISSTVITNNIVAYPKIDINSESDANTGMAKIKVIDMDVTLFVVQADEKTNFGSKTFRIRGSGKTKEQAITSALNSFQTKSTEWEKFLNQTKTKIIQYYEKMCDKIISRADQLAGMGKMEEAMAHLMYIPSEVSCYEKVKDKSLSIYKKYIDSKCSSLIQEAKSQLALKDYETAMNTITQIDPQSSCFKDADNLIAKSSKEINEEIKSRWDFFKKTYNDSVELEKMRIKAVRDIGVAYASREDNSQVINVIK